MFPIHFTYFTYLVWYALCIGFANTESSEAAADKSHQCGPGIITPGWTVPKGDIILEEGTPLEIYCVLDVDNQLAKENSAENIVFYNGSERINSRYITVINETAAKLHIDNVSVFNEMFYCKLATGYGNRSYAPSSLESTFQPSLSTLMSNSGGGGGGDSAKDELLVCLNNVVIGNKPKEVVNFSCYSYNWEYLNCSWTPPNNGVKTNYSIAYQLPPRRGNRNINFACPSTDDVVQSRCVWLLGSTPPYRRGFEYLYLTITGINKFGNVTQVVKFHHYAHVIPAAPQNLRVVEKTTSSIHLQWNVGAMNFFEKGLIHKVKHKWEKSPVWYTAEYNNKGLEKLKDEVKLNVTGLPYPNVAYDFRIYMRSGVAIGDTGWSAPSFLVVKTQACAPYAAPSTDVGSFEIIHGYETYREVFIYWRPLPELEHNGDNFHYDISVFDERGREVKTRPEKVTNFYARFENISNGRHTFEVRSTNSNGSSPYATRVVVPDKRDMVPDLVVFTKVDYGGGINELSWKPPNRTDIVNFTSFWCESARERPYLCDGTFNWIHLPANASKHNFTTDPTKSYHFAISANTANSSSGMVWALCTVLHDNVGQMKDVWIQNIDSYYMDLQWKLECADRLESICGYNVYYCPTSDAEKTECGETEKTLTVYGDVTTARANITNLKAFTSYRISMAILVKSGQTGPRSAYLYNVTQDGSPEVSGLKVEVSNISSTSALVRWDEPTQMNGVFQHYNVSYNDQWIEVKEAKALLANLASYTHYTLRVSACTRKHCAQLTEIAMHTKIGVPGVVGKPTAQKINSTHAVVTWKQPELSAGPNPIYDVRVQFDEADRNSTIYEFETAETKAMVPVPSCKGDLSHISYTYYVRAKNIDESNLQNGRTFVGDWSPAYTINCIHAGLSALWKIMLSISFFVFFLSLFIFYGKKGLYKCQQMKKVEVTLPPKFTIPPLFQNETKDQDYQVHIRTWTEENESDRLNVKLPEIDRTSIDCIDMDLETDRETSRSSSGCYTS